MIANWSTVHASFGIGIWVGALQHTPWKITFDISGREWLTTGVSSLATSSQAKSDVPTLVYVIAVEEILRIYNKQKSKT